MWADIDGWIEVSAKNKGTEKELIDLSSRHGYMAYALAVAVVVVQRRCTPLRRCLFYDFQITWNMILASYARDERIDVMGDLFEEIPKRDVIWWSTMIMAYAHWFCLSNEQGQFVYSSMNSVKFPMSVSIGAGLIDMYAKCGCIQMSKKVFSEMPRRVVWVWNVMISGLAMHDFGKEAVSLFKRFIREGVSPINATFIGILNACSRSGLVNDERHYFKLM
ncbi:hypothetical protein GIB67_007132 [Kingdonia uniflora]|uniref:Pentatricopeptide repeat-containing protein n=1 Tax=Kingdonia uniflora TaxID=39325 RepID=A0A7J7ML98_9MAGN|nr:hypothetical protein GIB67_007132 [Kingdonia uniflora]